MKLRTALGIALLAGAFAVAPQIHAQEKPFTEQQVLDMVHAGLGNDAGAKLIVQRGIGFTPTSEFLKHAKSAGAKDAFLKALKANKPLSQEQVTAMVNAAVGEDSGAQMITQRGIDFAPTEAYIASLKAAGAKEVFIKAVRARMALNAVQVIAQLAAEAPSQRVAGLLSDRGIDFEVKDDYLQQVREAGGDDDLISALKSAKVKQAAIPDPVAQTRVAAVLPHAARGAASKRKGQYAAAEQEFRASLTPGAPDADIDLSLAMVLGRQQKWDEDVTVAREAVSLNSDNGMAHIVLGAALAGRGDWDGAAAEHREALRLEKDDDLAHAYLGVDLGGKNDWDGEIREEREALRLNPNNGFAQANLGAALGSKGDWDEAIAEYRKAIDANPNNVAAHTNLGAALAGKGDWENSIAEYRKAVSLDPNSAMTHDNLGAALVRKGDSATAVEEYRAALRLNPNDDGAHVNLGDALRNNGDWDAATAEYQSALKLNSESSLAHAGLGLVAAAQGNWDGSISEEREALRINPNNAALHANLGDALEQKGDRGGALQEYQAAFQLDPKNINYKQNCDRLALRNR